MKIGTNITLTLVVVLGCTFLGFSASADAEPQRVAKSKRKNVKAGRTGPDGRHAKVVSRAKKARREIGQALDGKNCGPKNDVFETMDQLISEIEDLGAGTYCCDDCGPGVHGADVTCSGCSPKNDHIKCGSSKLKVDCVGNTVESEGGGLSCY